MTFKCVPFYRLNLDEFYACMALRQEVFVVEQDCPYLDADGKDQAAWHLTGFDGDGKLIAYSRLLPAGVAYKKYASIGRVVTSPAIRGQGMGIALMNTSKDWCNKLFPNQPVKISAQTYLLKFYKNLGFEPVGKEYLEDNIPHIGMVLNS
ncbi:MAG: GNAT family N-acetyltransferase [Bacteroidota bacterium]